MCATPLTDLRRRLGPLGKGALVVVGERAGAADGADAATEGGFVAVKYRLPPSEAAMLRHLMSVADAAGGGPRDEGAALATPRHVLLPRRIQPAAERDATHRSGTASLAAPPPAA